MYYKNIQLYNSNTSIIKKLDVKLLKTVLKKWYVYLFIIYLSEIWLVHNIFN